MLAPVYSKSSVLQSILVRPLSCCRLQTLDALCPPQECTWMEVHVRKHSKWKPGHRGSHLDDKMVVVELEEADELFRKCRGSSLVAVDVLYGPLPVVVFSSPFQSSSLLASDGYPMPPASSRLCVSNTVPRSSRSLSDNLSRRRTGSGTSRCSPS